MNQQRHPEHLGRQGVDIGTSFGLERTFNLMLSSFGVEGAHVMRR